MVDGGGGLMWLYEGRTNKKKKRDHTVGVTMVMISGSFYK